MFPDLKSLVLPMRVAMTPNDPSSPTPPTATVERTENVGVSETVDRKAKAAFGTAPLLGESSTESSQKSSNLPWITQGTLVSVLDLWKRRFGSISELMIHIEQHPTSVAILERMTRHLVSLKDGLSLWQEAGRPYVSWPGKDNLCDIQPQVLQPTQPNL